jgi:3-oxoacyl-[acyl-carrier protein] reductase
MSLRQSTYFFWRVVASNGRRFREGDMPLAPGTTVLVTGAARGLGWGIARAFARAGAAVCATDIDAEELTRATVEPGGDAARWLAFQSDVADLKQCQEVVARIVDRWGRLDVVVHNAIYMPLLTFDATTPAVWARQIEVGLGGLFNCAHAAWEQLKRQGGGHIIGIASGSSFRGYKEEIAYCAVKHGVEGFVKALALEARDYNIAVNTIGPGASIKPTRMTWAEYDALPGDVRAQWADPVALGAAWVWLAAQPPARFNGYRLDAGPLVETLTREGDDFAFAPEKVTLYPADFRERREWYATYPG